MNSPVPPIFVKPPDLRQETRVQPPPALVNDPEDIDHAMDLISELESRLTRLEKLLEGEVEAAAKSKDPVDAGALGRERILEALAEKIREMFR